MMGAVFAEMDEDWAGRRRLDDDSIGRAVEGAEVNAPAPAYGGAPPRSTLPGSSRSSRPTAPFPAGRRPDMS